MFQNLSAVRLVSILSLSGAAVAQAPAPPSAVADVSQASISTYRSAFDGYKPYTDDKLLNWKDANDTTGRIGGWRVYAKEAQQPDAKTPTHDMATMPEPKAGDGKP